jgi:hypothetical protein
VVRRGAGGSGGGGAPSGATGGAGVGDFFYGPFCGEQWAGGVGRFEALLFFDGLGFRQWERDGKRMGCTVASNVAS